MADNKINFDLEINEKSIETAFKPVSTAAGKSAKDSAAAFEQAFSKNKVAFPADVSAAFETQRKGIQATTKATSFVAISSLTDIYAGLALVKGGYDILKKSAEATLDVILEGDKILKTEKRFEALGAQVGIVADIFRNDLVKAVNGFVDDTELIGLASEAFIRLGDNAKQLPQVLEAARKTYAVFGGTIVDNANRIISATETGSKRTLKDIGLYVDLEGAVKKYAKSLGTIPSLLYPAQVEQARLNAILAVSQDRLSAVQNKASATTSYTQLKVALNDLNDEFSKLANSKLGGFFKAIADASRTAVESIAEGLKRARPAETISDLTFKLGLLRNKAEDYEKQLKELGTGSATLAFSANLKGQLVTIKEQISNYEELRRKLNNLAATQAQANKAGGGGAGDSTVDAARLQARKDLLQKINELNTSLNQSEIALQQDEFTRTKASADFERLNFLQKAQENAAYLTQVADLKKTFETNGTNDEALRLQGEQALRDTHFNKLLQIQNKYLADKKALTNEEAANVLTLADTYQQVLAGVAEGVRFQTTNMRQSLKDLGKAFVTTFKTEATKAIFAFAQGSKSASEAASDLFTGIINAMGEMLISQGLGFILQGIAFTYAGIPTGPALVGAGEAMVGLGAVLAAVSAANGGKVGASSDGGGSAGGIYANGNGNNDITKPIADTKPDAPKAVINVNVGQVFDRKETGMWIADILQERFDQDGITVRTT